MAGSALNLSMLSRGIGEVTKNGHEKVDVVLEPEDYYNYTIAGASNNFKLPPIEPKPAFEESPREVLLPKTFTTRKGALLLFSEDFALKARAAEREQDIRDGKAVATSFDDLDLRTVDDLTRSILTYGSGRGELHLRFVRNYAIPRKFRPGFSARRYLSRLTRSFDDSFLDNLMSKGFVQEKTLYQYNALLPKLKRRINDDISVMPAPYRIMKQMLMAPGLLSGYSFYTGRQDTVSSDLTIVLEESEAEDGQVSRKASGLKVVEVRDGEARRVSYNELTKEDKENVLADLLVKSAINHALEKQKQKLEDEVTAPSAGDQTAVRTRLSSLQSSEAAELDMAEAVRSYLESKVDKESVPNADTARSGSLRGSKVSSHSAKSFEARPIVLPDTVGEKEFVGGVPVASVKDTVSDTASVNSLASSHTSRDVSKPASQPAEAVKPAPPTALSPIKDEGSFVQSRETTFSQTPVLPPIRPVVQTLGEPVVDKDALPASGVPQVNIQPPTPQHSTLTAAGASPKPVSREPTVRAMVEESESEEGSEPEKEWKGDISEEEILEKKQEEEEATKKKRELSKKGSTQSLLSAVSVDSPRGPVLGAGSPLLSSTESIGDQLGNSLQSFGSMKGHALRATKPTKSQPKARKSPKKDSETASSNKGSVIVGPGGAVLSVGGAISGTSEPSIDAVSEANKTPRDPVDAQSETAAPTSEDEDAKKSWPGQGHLSAHSKTSKISAKSGYHKTHKTREIDPTSGDFNATLGVSSWSYNPPSIIDKSSESGASQTQSSKHPHSLDQSEAGDTDRRSPFPEQISEQELVEALTDHAHKIASSILTKPGTGEDLAEDAQAAAFLWLDRKSDISRSQSEQNLTSDDAVLDHFFAERGGVKSAAPTTSEYRELLKETLSSALSKLANTGVEFPPDAEVSPELIEALAKQGLSADDIEVIVGEDGKTIITLKEGKRPADQTGAPSRGQVKEGHTYQQPQKGGSDSPTGGATQQGLPISIPTGRPRETDLGEPAVIHYGEGREGKPSQGSPDAAAAADGKKSRASSLKLSEPGSPTRVSSVAKSAAGKSAVSFKDEDGEGERRTEEDEKQFLESLAQEADKLSGGKPGDTKSLKSGKSVKSTKSSKSIAKSEKSRSSLKSPGSDDSKGKEEFVVGKVPDKHELSNLYGRTEEPPKPKEKKPRVPPAKPKKTKAGKKKGKGKETSKEDAKKAKHAEKHATPTSQKELSPMPPDDKSLSPAPSGTVSGARSKEEEEMEFIFVDDEFPDGASSVSVKSLKSAKSGLRSGAMTQFTEGTEMEDDSEGSSPSNLVSNKDARAAKRAARAAKKREEVERKRKEREEQLRREREEAERRETMQRDLEEERRRKEEERRLKREREEEERRQAEEAEAARERRARMEMEREKRMKEEYQRKLEILRRQQQEEERIRREMEEKMRLEEEERLRLEQLMLSKMKAEEREEYERRKKQEEEDKLRRAELERLKLEEESRLAMEEARRVAAEMARQQAEYERRLQFNRSLQLEAEGMETHSLNITEAFTFSYYELLKWLGMDLPEFDHLKMDRKY